VYGLRGIEMGYIENIILPFCNICLKEYVLVVVLASGKTELFFRVSKVHCINEYSMGS